MERSHKYRRAVMALGILLACCRGACALDPSLDISQYAHTAWKVRDGFTKGGITAIAQTPDGYLWLGTEFGLVRFDGVRAVEWQPPNGQHLPSNIIQRLLVSRDGTLWIGTRKGVASWRDGRLTRYPELTEHSINSLLEDHEGTIWVGEWQPPQGRLCAIRNGVVECYGADGSLGWGALSLFEDSKGNLWVAGGGPPKFALWHWKPGPPQSYATGFFRCFKEDSDGALSIGTPQGLMRLVDGKLEPRPDALPGSARGLSVSALQEDGDGGLWVGLLGGGLVHIHGGRTDVYTQSDGLSGNMVWALFRDREGSIWVTTTDGLDRFRNFTVPTWSQGQGVFTMGAVAVLAGNEGAIWVGTVKGLAKLHEGDVTIYPKRPETEALSASQAAHKRFDNQFAEALLQDHNGRLWIASHFGLSYLEGEQVRTIPPFGARVIGSLAEDPSGDLWVQAYEEGLFRIRNGRMTQHIPLETLGHKDYGRSLAVDQLRGGLWVGFSGGGLVYVKDSQIRSSYSVSDGLGQGNVSHLRFGPLGTLWAATEGGLSRIRDGRIATLTSKNGLPCDEVHWSMEDNDQSIWFYMPCGLVRIARSELDAWVSDPKRNVQPVIFGANDGVRTVAPPGGFFPRVSKAPDGRIWFSAVDGVSVIDPRHLPYNKLPPPVHIEQITADGKVYDAASGSARLRLPPLVRNLDIDYTALSLVVPEKVRFRFKLEGQDKDWRELVNIRHVEYTNLPPRHYRFRVTACNNSGVWNT